MPQLKRWIGFILFSLGAVIGAAPAAATVIVQNGDISGGEYLFEINYGNHGTQYSAALLSSTNFTPTHFCCSATAYVLAQQGQSFAQFTFEFDFSATSFLPSAVEITDRVTLFTNTATERVEAKVQYSYDGVNFFDQRTTQTPNDGTVVIDDWQTYQLGVAGNAFYYRVTMVPMAIDPDGVFTHPQDQWGRADGPGTGTTTFSARFFVPEPALALLLALGLVGGVGVLRNR